MNEHLETKQRRIDPWLIAIVVFSAIGGALLVIGARNWALMTDELLYGEMARSIASSGVPLPQARGELVHVNQFLYPLLIAPIVGVLSMPDAYPVVAAFNAVVMASAAVPIYMLANMASGSRVAARWAALCSVCLPWLALASKMLPDAVAYAALMWTLYALARTAGDRAEGWRGNLPGDLLALMAIALTYLVRNQFIVLLGVWVGVVFARRIVAAVADSGASTRTPAAALAAAWRALWRTPLERPLPIATLVIVFIITRLEPVWLLGLYAPTTTGAQGQVAPTGLIGAMYDHLGTVAVALAGLPLVFGLPWLFSALARGRDAAENQAAIVIAVTSVVLLFVGASFNVRFGDERVLERYVFYIAPLILIAGVSVFSRPPKNLALFAGPAILGLLTLGAIESYGLSADVVVAVNHAFSPAQIGLVVLQEIADVFTISIYALLLAVSIVVGGASWVLIERDRGQLALNISFALVFATVLATTIYAVPKAVSQQNEVIDSIYGMRTDAQKAWVDEFLCDGIQPVKNCSASIVFAPLIDVTAQQKSGSGEPRKPKRDERLSSWWDLEFWNGDFDAFYTTEGLVESGFNPVFPPIEKITVDWRTGLIKLAEDKQSEYLVVAQRDPRFQPQSAPGSFPFYRDGFAMYLLTDPPKAAWASQGLTRLGWVPPEGATVRVYSPSYERAPAKMRVAIHLATTKGPKGLDQLANAPGQKPRVKRKESGQILSYTIEVPALGYGEIPLEWKPEAIRDPSLRGNAHVERIVAFPLP